MKKDWDILVIDDEQVVIDAVVKICSAEDYTIDSAIDAKEALQKFDRNSYKLIVCDIMMPGIDGFGFLDELHKRKISSVLNLFRGFEFYLCNFSFSI